MRRGPFFFFFFLLFTFQTTEICLRSTKVGIFYREMRKNDFAPSEKYSSYPPVSFTHVNKLSQISNDTVVTCKVSLEIDRPTVFAL